MCEHGTVWLNYLKNLKKELFCAITKAYWLEDWIFSEDGAPSDTSNLVQDFLKETIVRRYIKREQWLPKPPYRNPLDYYFCNKVKTKLYEDRLNNFIENEEELISKNKVGLEGRLKKS